MDRAYQKGPGAEQQAGQDQGPAIDAAIQQKPCQNGKEQVDQTIDPEQRTCPGMGLKVLSMLNDIKQTRIQPDQQRQGQQYQQEGFMLRSGRRLSVACSWKAARRRLRASPRPQAPAANQAWCRELVLKIQGRLQAK